MKPENITFRCRVEDCGREIKGVVPWEDNASPENPQLEDAALVEGGGEIILHHAATKPANTWMAFGHDSLVGHSDLTNMDIYITVHGEYYRIGMGRPI
jgi:hypothetical protein